VGAGWLEDLGSISVAGITAAWIPAAIAGNLDTPVVPVARAAESGTLVRRRREQQRLLGFQSLLRFTTRGTVKTHLLPMILASAISLPSFLTLSLLA
jgi:GntP family gluconate:H+ symporter